MYCSKCGHLLTDGSKFCSNCGAVIDIINKNTHASSAPTQQESIKHIQKSIAIELTGQFKEEIEEEFRKATKTKHFEDALCDLIFTNKYIYLVPATKDKSGWQAMAGLAGPLYGLADYFIEKGITALQNNAKRPSEHSEIIASNARDEIPCWLFDEVSLSVYEKSEGIPFLNKTNAVNFVLKGPCHYKNKVMDYLVHFKIYGSVLNAGSFGLGYTRPADFDPLARLFRLTEKDIQVR